MQNRTEQPGVHPKLYRIWHGPAEILGMISANIYSVNLNVKVVILWVGRLKTYIPRRDGVKYNQRHHITVSTDSLRDIKLWLDQLICCPDAQPEGVYKLSCLASSLGMNQADPPPPSMRLDVPAAPEPVSGLQLAVSQGASMVFTSLFSPF